LFSQAITSIIAYLLVSGWGGDRRQPISDLTDGREEGRVTDSYNLLRSHLESEQKRLTEQLAQSQASVRPAEERREGSPFGKREEEASETMELETRLALEKRIRDQLAEVEHALQKFEDGTYGLCENCGKPIDPERLEALPQATLCMSCKTQQAKDAKGKASSG
jgi:DnaK suppressor protein